MLALLKSGKIEFDQRSRKLIRMLGQDEKRYKDIHLMVICLKNIKAKVSSTVKERGKKICRWRYNDKVRKNHV